MRYLRLFHGILGSLLSTALSRYVLRMSIHTWKSDSLKSYETFQPILPYFLRSCTTAWKNASTNTRDEKAEWGHSANAWVEILKYVLRRFSFNPLGGSVTTCQVKQPYHWPIYHSFTHRSDLSKSIFWDGYFLEKFGKNTPSIVLHLTQISLSYEYTFNSFASDTNISVLWITI